SIAMAQLPWLSSHGNLKWQDRALAQNQWYTALGLSIPRTIIHHQIFKLTNFQINNPSALIILRDFLIMSGFLSFKINPQYSFKSIFMLLDTIFRFQFPHTVGT